MKTRNTLSAIEVDALYQHLDSKLSTIGVETQPAVATRILDISANPEAGMSDYAKIIRNDPGLSGRLLRLANSAYFAQRKPVTNVERACILLGLGRLRSIALGFYLSRAAATDASQEVSRVVWGQSVYRACLAAEIARTTCAGLAPEAFVVGLMLDAGVPLTAKLMGGPFESLFAQQLPPLKSFSHEFDQHPYTHVDVVAVLVRRWRMPDLIAKPIEWHHTPPSPVGKQDPIRQLHRVAYYVGSVGLTPEGTPKHSAPMATTANVHLGLDAAHLRDIASKATEEYDLVLELFSDVAQTVQGVADLTARVHRQLVDVLDEQMTGQLADDTQPRPQQFRLGGLLVMLRPDEKGLGTAYAYDSQGEPLSTYRFLFATESPASIREALGLDPDPTDDTDAISEYIGRLAA